MSLEPADQDLATLLMSRDDVPFWVLMDAINDALHRTQSLGESLVSLGAVDVERLPRLRIEAARHARRTASVDTAADGDTLFDITAETGPPTLDEAETRPPDEPVPQPARRVSGLAVPVVGGIRPTDPTPPTGTVAPTVAALPGDGREEGSAPALSGPDLASRDEHALAEIHAVYEEVEAESMLVPETRTLPTPVLRPSVEVAVPLTSVFTDSAADSASFAPTRPSLPARKIQDSSILESQTLRPGHASSRFPAGPGPGHVPPPREETVRARSSTLGVDVPVEPVEGPLSPSGKEPGERYQLLGEIGRGGMGRILKARDSEIRREVAVKIMLAPGAIESQIRRFWTEVRALGQLEHPSIIPIHDVGRLATGELFYVMKKLGGRTLSDIIRALNADDAESRREFTRARLLTVLQQVAYAVAFAHAHGVIHRDIKPANIMVGQYGEAILIDWGLAKILENDTSTAQTDDLEEASAFTGSSGSNTASGTITGTPQYMSPEATEGKPELLTTRSDVYGLGAVLYEILTWQAPYPDLGFVPTVMRVREHPAEPPRVRAPGRDISPELEELCLTAMARDPAERPLAKELADELGRVLAGAKERERRSTEAKARVRAGRQAMDQWKTLKVELQTAEIEAKRLSKEVPPWAAVEDKLPIWALEDRVSELKIEAVSAFEEAEADFLRALGEVPDDREARSALASLYFARFGEAERARDSEGQRYYRRLVARYDDGVWQRVLEGHGTLEVTSQPDGVEVTLAPYETRRRIMQAGESRSLGSTPIHRFEIPIGSYQLTFHRPGERDILRPVLIGRTEEVTVHADLPSSAQIGDQFMMVLDGPVILGGDPVAHGALERKIVDVPGYAIARFPVTCDEYLAFLNEVATTDLDRALAHVPRARAQEGHYWAYDPGAGSFRYPERTPGGQHWTGRLPVNGVSFDDACAYAAWRRERTGEPLRLPTEREWEKAARGVDGRFFPWGDQFDPTFCKMKESRSAAYPEPEPVGTFMTDCSPYGVRDMAGSIRELCTSDPGDEPVVRGGCWSDTGLFCRVAFRHVTQRSYVNTGLGFRLAKDIETS